MIRDYLTLESVAISYKGQPSNVTISMDGTAVSSIFDLPSHRNYATRRISVPSESSGFVPHFSTDSNSLVDHRFNIIPASAFDTQLIWHYYELSISGDVNVSLDLDGVNKVSGKNLQVPTSEAYNERKATTANTYIVNAPSATTDSRLIEGFTPAQMLNISLNDSVSLIGQADPLDADIINLDDFAGVLSGIFVARKGETSILLNEAVSLGTSTYLGFMPTIADRKKYHTVKLYFPPLSYGYTPHVSNSTSDQGYIIKAKPVALPARYYSKSTSMSEGQITYQGTVRVQFYLDGNALGTPYQFIGERTSTGTAKYVTKKFPFPSGAIGRVFQWNIDGDYGTDGAYGDVASIETDASLSATDVQPQIPALGGNL
jgi:hypothetical protein